MVVNNFLTNRQLELIDLLEGHTLKVAVTMMEPPVKYTTGKAMMHEVRRKRSMAQNTVNYCNGKASVNRQLFNFLTPFKRVPPG